MLACFTFLIGFILSSCLLRFLFGTGIYSPYNYYGLLAPSFSYLHLRLFIVEERIISYLIDAFIFGGVLYAVISAAVGLFSTEKYP